jgi:hypothetical protein
MPGGKLLATGPELSPWVLAHAGHARSGARTASPRSVTSS